MDINEQVKELNRLVKSLEELTLAVENLYLSVGGGRTAGGRSPYDLYENLQRSKELLKEKLYKIATLKGDQT